MLGMNVSAAWHFKSKWVTLINTATNQCLKSEKAPRLYAKYTHGIYFLILRVKAQRSCAYTNVGGNVAGTNYCSGTTRTLKQ